MPELRLFASAREAAGTPSARLPGDTVGEVLDEAAGRFGEGFTAVLGSSKVWVNGAPTTLESPVTESDVVAVLPPVSGGSGDMAVEAGTLATVGRGRPRFDPVIPEAPPPPPVVAGAVAEALGVEPSPEPPRQPEPPVPLAVVPQVRGPHGRLGILWAVVTVLAVVAGRGWLAVWFGLLAAVAGLQVARVWRRQNERPLAAAAGIGAGGLTLAAAWGLGAMTAVVVAITFGCLVGRLRVRTRCPTRDVGLTVLIALSLGAAAASPVLVRGLGRGPCLVLLALVCAHDVGAYLVGTGAHEPWEGPAAGVVSMLPVTIVVAVVMVPPFGGAAPWLLGLTAAVLVPLGPLVGSALLGDGTVRAPGLRRLDALLLAGPVWAFTALALLR